MKTLVVGDPHMTPDDLSEGRRFVDFVEAQIKTHEPVLLIFLGDLFHTFSLAHVEVISFWREAMERLSKRVMEIIIIRGNHDGPHDARPGIHALATLSQFATIIDRPEVRFSLGFVPYCRDPAEFVAACKSLDVKTIYCHQSFNGAEYESGIYCQDGVNPDDIPQKLVISGHIHSGQEFGSIFYPGSPRWLTLADANQDRFIWFLNHDVGEGTLHSRVRIPTDPCCLRLAKLRDSPDAPAVDPGNAGRLAVDIHGPAAWVQERKLFWRGKARVRTFPVTERRARVRESEGIAKAFDRYLSEYKPLGGTAAAVLQKMITERRVFT